MSRAAAVVEAGRFRRAVAVTAALTLAVGSAVVLTGGSASADVLAGSDFEIDGTAPAYDANLKQDGSSTIDWLTAAGVLRITPKADKPTGSGDDSFGNGTSEDTAVPSVVSGSIPPNKSDLKSFGVFQESKAGQTNVALFWSRVQNPKGTTNMDFEFNQNTCVLGSNGQPTAGSACTTNLVTPVRKSGDLLITYDLDNGGTKPTISKRVWSGSAWGPAKPFTDDVALGSVNTTTIPSSESGGIGQQDPYTFGEAIINLNKALDATCGAFGSVYLKSRSSSSFTAALKDFVAPQPVNISNCSTITTSATATATIGSSIKDSATLGSVTPTAGGTVTYTAYSDATCSTSVFSSTVNVSNSVVPDSGAFTPSAVGTYYWIASYSGDTNNVGATGACGDANESSVVGKTSPGIATSATASVTIGSAISDTATLSGATSDAGGTVTYSAYSDSSCLGTAAFSSTVNVTNGVVPGSGSFTPSAVGTYKWIASYSGDSKNGSVSGACGDTGETSVVNKAASTVSTTQSFYPNDTATFSAGAGGTPTGTATFTLHTTSNCSDAALYTAAARSIDSSGAASTANTTYAVSTSGTYYWKVVYAGDAKHNGVTSCTENTVLTISNGSPVSSS